MKRVGITFPFRKRYRYSDLNQWAQPFYIQLMAWAQHHLLIHDPYEGPTSLLARSPQSWVCPMGAGPNPLRQNWDFASVGGNLNLKTLTWRHYLPPQSPSRKRNCTFLPQTRSPLPSLYHASPLTSLPSPHLWAHRGHLTKDRSFGGVSDLHLWTISPFHLQHLLVRCQRVHLNCWADSLPVGRKFLLAIHAGELL